MTHPFHPLHGREFELIEITSMLGAVLVHYTADDGTLRTVRQAFTSAAAVDPFAPMREIDGRTPSPGHPGRRPAHGQRFPLGGEERGGGRRRDRTAMSIRKAEVLAFKEFTATPWKLAWQARDRIVGVYADGEQSPMIG